MKRDNKGYPVYDKPYVEVLADKLTAAGVNEREVEEMRRLYLKHAPKGLQEYARLMREIKRLK